jgi:RNA polymerase sigma-70 factor (ECF subfamily)
MSTTLTPEQSIELLERCHGRMMRRYLTRLTGDFQRAEDIYQETLVRAWKHPEERDARGCYALPWLFTVARRISIDYLRATAIRPAEVSDSHIPAARGGADTTDKLLAAHEVRRALATLPSHQRQIIYEMYFLDRPAQEIAERLDVPLGTVKSRAHYAVRTLRKTLTEPGLATAA